MRCGWEEKGQRTQQGSVGGRTACTRGGGRSSEGMGREERRGYKEEAGVQKVWGGRRGEGTRRRQEFR
eukprot:219155-Hanusia_phi.AAC.1